MGAVMKADNIALYDVSRIGHKMILRCLKIDLSCRDSNLSKIHFFPRETSSNGSKMTMRYSHELDVVSDVFVPNVKGRFQRASTISGISYCSTMAPEGDRDELVKETSLAPSSVTLLKYNVLKKVAESFKEHFSQRHFILKPYSLAVSTKCRATNTLESHTNSHQGTPKKILPIVLMAQISN
ncbi:CLUMA_CG019169, isoform A [Clunio marinus]|uniref:CLUMA_CG019169, isoform A n=1 Tax=Clunio marinus TaxID=568069 RepID=A0A1J1J247_9DIPT|nr:CLUMA_CG019169, isoform A [Clunio marinus]